MKLSSNLLKTLALGVAVAGITACSQEAQVARQSKKTRCNEDCLKTGVHQHKQPRRERFDCPACGMG